MLETNRFACAVALAAGLVLAGCGGDEPAPAMAAAGGPSFVADSAGEGARLWIEASIDGDLARIEVWAAELGAVFGYAAHVEYDSTHLALEGAPASDADVLAGGDPATALHAWTGAAGDLAFGGTRRAASLGAVEIDAPVRLGVVTLRATAAKQSRIAPARVVVRRADAAFVPTAAVGGTLRTGGAS